MIRRRSDPAMQAVEVKAKESGEDVRLAKFKARLVDLICSSKVINRIEGTRIIDGLFEEVKTPDIIAELNSIMKEFLSISINNKNG